MHDSSAYKNIAWRIMLHLHAQKMAGSEKIGAELGWFRNNWLQYCRRKNWLAQKELATILSASQLRRR